MKILRINEIVHSISETHAFDKERLIPINTSDVYEGEMQTVDYAETDSLKGQFKKTIQYDDILFSEIRPANRRYARVKYKECEDFVVSTKLMVLRKFNDEVDLDYFYYCLTNQPFLNILQKRAENRIGSFPQITFDLLAEYSFPIPQIEEQKKVANFLSCIDRKIANNRKTIAMLETMAKQLYDYWFVQFDFPDADGKPYKSSGGKMVWNEKLKREIPEGWEVKEINDSAIVQRGNIITSSETLPGNIKVVAAALDFAYYHNVANRASNVITVSCSGANAGFINFWREPIFASDCTTVQCEDSLDTLLCLHGMRLHQERLMKNAHGSAQPHVYPNQVGELPVIIAPKTIKEKIRTVFITSNTQIAKCEQEITRLSSLRDFLLPMLMNGQVTITPSANE